MFELYGTGNLKTQKTDLLDAIRLAISKGIIVVAISQCLDGRVSLKSYAYVGCVFSCVCCVARVVQGC